MKILQTPRFKNQVKKLHKNQTYALHQALDKLVNDPFSGEMKKGDLSGIRVLKFKMVNCLTLLAYEYNEDESVLILYALGSHENFYRDLKQELTFS